jgi:hypothetical protein
LLGRLLLTTQPAFTISFVHWHLEEPPVFHLSLAVQIPQQLTPNTQMPTTSLRGVGTNVDLDRGGRRDQQWNIRIGKLVKHCYFLRFLGAATTPFLLALTSLVYGVGYLIPSGL